LSTPTLDPGGQLAHGLRPHQFRPRGTLVDTASEMVGGERKLRRTNPTQSANELRFQENPAMAFVSLRQVLDHAAEHGYGVPAFNVNNLEQIHAIMEAADETQSPGDPASFGRGTQVRGRALFAAHGARGGGSPPRHPHRATRSMRSGAS
jgi:hypothetical protein